jgi:SAM-dependent methyltransferase
MRSNKFKNISGDGRLNFFQHLYWLVVAFANILLDKSKFDSRIKVVRFFPKKLDTFSKKDLPSPSRYWCDLFWHSLPFKIIFNDGFKALEAGCGSGIYGNFLKTISNFTSYKGIDINEKDSWKADNVNFNFYKDTCYNVGKYLHDTNFLFTQSALEHFDRDLDFHQHVNNFIKNNINNNKKFFQLHLVPSGQCLFSYLAHGYRHYTPNTISKISSLYSDGQNTRFILFELGSKNSWLMHIKCITLAKFFSFLSFREFNKNNYIKALDEAVQKDIENPKKNEASFYAFMILSNYSNTDVDKIVKYYK